MNTSLMAAMTHYVNTATLKVRLGANTKAAHSYSVYKGHRVKVYEIQDGWARISRYKSSAIDGKFSKRAHWVFATYLSEITSNIEKKREIEQEIQKLEQNDSANTHFVNASKLKVRQAPSTKGSHMFSLEHKSKVKVYDVQNGWARISETKENKTQWVYAKYLTRLPCPKRADTKAESKPEEKIEAKIEPQVVVQEEIQLPIKPRVLRELEEEELEEIPETLEYEVFNAPEVDEPKDIPAGIDPRLYEVISESDKFENYKDVFLETSQRLYNDGICRMRDFKRTKGWIEISENILYFVYCGKIKRSNKIYLNVITGEATK